MIVELGGCVCTEVDNGQWDGVWWAHIWCTNQWNEGMAARTGVSGDLAKLVQSVQNIWCPSPKERADDVRKANDCTVTEPLMILC